MAASPGFPRTGVAYVGQMEHEYMNLHKLSCCSNCFALGWDRRLKRCNGCQLVDYCTRECQKAQWSKHKGFCNMVQGKGRENAYLTGFSHAEVLRVLIDAYRLRVELDHAHRDEDHGIYHPGKWVDGIVWVQGEVVDDFQSWLDLTETAGVLPKWWRFEDRMECLGMAIDSSNAENVSQPIKQDDLFTRYEGDMTIRNGLCILAELVVGYEGKGPAQDDRWFDAFQEHLDLHPQERARLLEGSVQAVRAAIEQHGPQMPGTLTENTSQNPPSPPAPAPAPTLAPAP